LHIADLLYVCTFLQGSKLCVRRQGRQQRVQQRTCRERS
jgi:hypothetical protein